MIRIDTKRGRDLLEPRREPYWYKLGKGRYIGLRKLNDGHAAWIARYRDDQGDQKYRALGEHSEGFDFDQAKAAAETWMSEIERGVSDRRADGKTVTIGSACAEYIRALRAQGREATAHDAHMRFRRTVYGDTFDAEFGIPKVPAVIGRSAPAQAKRDRSSSSLKRRKWLPEPQALAETALAKVRSPRLCKWHLELISKGLSKAAANRTLTALKAALNLAVTQRAVSPIIAQEWSQVVPFKDASQRRDLFLDVDQRRKLLRCASGAVRDLIEAAMCTGCRAGELTSARRSAFDARTKSLSVSGKTGPRTIPLAPAAVDLFTRLSKDKLPSAYLLTRDDGHPWAHSDWDELVKDAARAAELPEKTCLYTMRHSFITQALLDGMSTLEVSKIAGTSLPMIEKHYGHLVQSTARERLAKVQII